MLDGTTTSDGGDGGWRSEEEEMIDVPGLGLMRRHRVLDSWCLGRPFWGGFAEADGRDGGWRWLG